MDDVPRPTPDPPWSPPSKRNPAYITAVDVRREVERMFDGGAGSGLVIRVHGESGEAFSAEAHATFREMFESLSIHGIGSGTYGDQLVAPPTRAAIAAALGVLGEEARQREVLDKALTTFGRRLIDPLAGILEPPTSASAVPRLHMLRDRFIAQLRDLRLSHESQRILSDDLLRLMNDDYLAMIAEHEEREQRPRARALAQTILHLVAQAFYRAFQTWPAHAESIALAIVRRLPKQVRLSDVPALMRAQITAGIEEFLWVETSNDIKGALAPLVAQHVGLSASPPLEIDRTAYRELAEACFGVVVNHC